MPAFAGILRSVSISERGTSPRSLKCKDYFFLEAFFFAFFFALAMLALQLLG
jgi:hypothetical protein